jgi:hypothetical protein
MGVPEIGTKNWNSQPRLLVIIDAGDHICGGMINISEFLLSKCVKNKLGLVSTKVVGLWGAEMQKELKW